MTRALILLLAAGLMAAGAHGRPAKHHEPPREHVAPAPPPPAPPPLTPPVPGPATGTLPDATERVDEGFRDLFPVHDHRYVVAAVPTAAPAEPMPVEDWHPYRLMLIACPLAAILAWYFARWMLPDVRS